jgi:polyhydroxyalkanoate synthesis regulator phasin
LENQLKSAATEFPDETPLPSDAEMEQLLAKHDVPSRSELQELSSQLEALMSKLDTLSEAD